jgi:YggT family protein
MGGTHVINAGGFLIQTIFGLYILAIMLRFLFQWVKADFYNPVSQFLVKVTNPPLVPLRRVIPGLMGIDLAAVVLMLVLQVIEVELLLLIKGANITIPGLLVYSLVELLSLGINVFFFSILIQVILSWVNPGAYNPVTALLYSLNEPLMRPARRILPPISGFDLSPILALVFLQLLTFLVINPLLDVAAYLMRG